MKSTIVWFQSLPHNLYLKFNDMKRRQNLELLEKVGEKKMRNQTRMISFGLKSETIWQQNDNKHMEGEEK